MDNRENIETTAANGKQEKERGTENKRIALYLLLVFAGTYLYEWIFVVRYLKDNPGDNIASVSLRVAFAMFIPSLCVVLTRLLTKEGFKDSFVNFNVKNGRYRYYLIAWFVTPVFILIGTVLYFLCFKSDFSPDMKYIIGVYEGQGVSGLTPQAMKGVAVRQGITAVLFGPLINCVTCFGEEWGWRGYLLVKLKDRLSTLPLMLVTGIIWGLWHVPLTIMGHNYGMDYAGYPYLGITAMIVFCFSAGTLLSYVTLKSGSCIPAVIGHGALNALSAIGIFFTGDGGRMLLGPSPSGFVAGLPLLIFAVILIRLMDKDEEKGKYSKKII